MHSLSRKYLSSFLFLVAFIPMILQAQTEADSLYQSARTAAFEQKDYVLAVQLTRQSLELEPDRDEVRVFLGRVLAWQTNYADAEQQLKMVLDKNAVHRDARSALLDVLLWSGQYEAMEATAREGLEHFIDNPDLLYQLGVSLLKQGQARKAQSAFQRVAVLDSDYPQLQTQLAGLKDALKDRKARLILGYDQLADTRTAWQFLVVDPTLDPWRVAALEYQHSSPYGPLILRLTAANRFATGGRQVELEAYPKLGQTRYGYVGFGVSASSIFPAWRGGVEFFQDLGQGFEASVGLRYLKVPNQMITVYTGSLGKYLGNIWLNARSFITPQSDVFSRSFNFVIRRYLADADQYWELSAGSGEVPDENLGADEISYLSARRLEGVWQLKLRPATLLQIRLSLSNQEVRTAAFRGSTGLSLSLEQRF